MAGGDVSREQVLLSYGILAAVLLTAAGFLLVPAAAGRVQFLDELESIRDLHVRSIDVLDTAARRLEAADEVQERLPSQTFLAGDTPALAAAELQNRIKRIVEREDALLVSSAFGQRDEDAPVTPIAVSVRARSSVDALYEILAALESAAPLLFVDELAIQSRHRPGRPLRESKDELDLEFRVTGFMNRPTEQ